MLSHSHFLSEVGACVLSMPCSLTAHERAVNSPKQNRGGKEPCAAEADVDTRALWGGCLQTGTQHHNAGTVTGTWDLGRTRLHSAYMAPDLIPQGKVGRREAGCCWELSRSLASFGSLGSPVSVFILGTDKFQTSPFTDENWPPRHLAGTSSFLLRQSLETIYISVSHNGIKLRCQLPSCVATFWGLRNLVWRWPLCWTGDHRYGLFQSSPHGKGPASPGGPTQPGFTRGLERNADAHAPSCHGKQMGKQWKQCQTLFFGAPKSLQMVIAAMKLKDAYSLEGKLWPT